MPATAVHCAAIARITLVTSTKTDNI